MESPPSLAAYPVQVEIPVAWGDMDAFAHVNNVQYFRYFETARIAYFAATGAADGRFEGAVGPILRDASCRFLRPVAYPDTLLVGASVTEVGPDRFTMAYLAHSRAQDADVARGTGVLVSYDYATSRKAQLPQATVEAIGRLEAGAGR